jgi:AraC family transcriptional regulator of arabinose operon
VTSSPGDAPSLSKAALDAPAIDVRIRLCLDRLEQSVEHGAPVTLEELARDVNLSPSRLRHLFRETVGRSPTQYLRLLRMTQAKRLLDTTFLRVKEVMCAVGSNDLSHFVRDFKRLFGQAPGRYRWRRLQERGNEPPRPEGGLSGAQVREDS